MNGDQYAQEEIQDCIKDTKVWVMYLMLHTTWPIGVHQKFLNLCDLHNQGNRTWLQRLDYNRGELEMTLASLVYSIAFLLQDDILYSQHAKAKMSIYTLQRYNYLSVSTKECGIFLLLRCRLTYSHSSPWDSLRLFRKHFFILFLATTCWHYLLTQS